MKHTVLIDKIYKKIQLYIYLSHNNKTFLLHDFYLNKIYYDLKEKFIMKPYKFTNATNPTDPSKFTNPTGPSKFTIPT
jgi:hypothetical protein